MRILALPFQQQKDLIWNGARLVMVSFAVYIVGLAKPDLVVFFDIEPRVAALRGEYGNERYENIPFQELVKSNYLMLRDDSWRMVDASKGKAEVEKQVGDIVKQALETIALDGKIEMNLWRK